LHNSAPDSGFKFVPPQCDINRECGVFPRGAGLAKHRAEAPAAFEDSLKSF